MNTRIQRKQNTTTNQNTHQKKTLSYKYIRAHASEEEEEQKTTNEHTQQKKLGTKHKQYKRVHVSQ